jgi:hypothetical protein
MNGNYSHVILSPCSSFRMVELAIEDRVVPKEIFNEKAVSHFIEKQLLPAINAQPAEKAHNMSFALQAIIEVSQTVDTPRLPTFAVVWCTVLCCAVLYCVVLCCTVLYCNILYCSVLYCTVLHCTVLCCAMLRFV